MLPAVFVASASFVAVSRRKFVSRLIDLVVRTHQQDEARADNSEHRTDRDHHGSAFDICEQREQQRIDEAHEGGTRVQHSARGGGMATADRRRGRPVGSLANLIE